MRRFLTKFFLTISMLLFSMTLTNYLGIHSFDHNSVKNNIDFLSSDALKGRLPGTLENKQAEVYIKTQFINNKLLPYDKNYYDSFKTLFPNRLDASPYLKIEDKHSNLIKEYTYGIDYKEDMLNFKNNKVDFNKKDDIKVNDSTLLAVKGSDKFVFYVSSENNLGFRSSFISSSQYSMCVLITKNTLSDLKTYLSKGYTVKCFIPFEAKETTIDNVIGYIKGRDQKAPPLILSAHFDHVGTDLNNTVYSGALDNASGISFLMELSKYVYSLGMPERNIIFIGFNAEEFGCLGSQHFVEKNITSLKGSKVFNFDMIGSNNSVPLYLVAGKKDTNKSDFMRSISSTCNNEHISYNYMFEDSSDHEAFRKNNIDAVTLCDNDMSRIHTPNDKADFINTNSIDRAYNVISREIIKYAYDGNPLLVLYKKTLIISFVSMIFLSILNVIFGKK